MLTLYSYPTSTCSQKVKLCLAEKGLGYETQTVDLARDENLSPDYLALNPNGVVPTLVHDGAVICDSSVIMEYLEEMFPEPALSPSDPVGRAHMRAWLRYVEEVPTAAIRYPSFNTYLLKRYQALDAADFEARATRRPLRRDFYREMGREGFSDEAMEASRRRLRQTAERMESALGAGPWVMGAELTIVDFALAPTFDRMRDIGMDAVWAGLPAVAAWLARLSARPSYAAAFAPGARFSERYAPQATS